MSSLTLVDSGHPVVLKDWIPAGKRLEDMTDLERADHKAGSLAVLRAAFQDSGICRSRGLDVVWGLVWIQ
jgi:hypothetical protein